MLLLSWRRDPYAAQRQEKGRGERSSHDVRIQQNWRPRLPACAPEENDWDRAQHDTHVFHHALAGQILDIVAHLRAHIIEAGVVALIHLRPSGDPRSGKLSERVLMDVVPE